MISDSKLQSCTTSDQFKVIKLLLRSGATWEITDSPASFALLYEWNWYGRLDTSEETFEPYHAFDELVDSLTSK
jgi:hypothetical protein